MTFELAQVPVAVWIQLTFPASGTYHDRSMYMLTNCWEKTKTAVLNSWARLK